MNLFDIPIRDPFILPHAGDELYYLFGTTRLAPAAHALGGGFDCYLSPDLQTWDGPFPVFNARGELANLPHFWAPEVHERDGAFWMFASMGTSTKRGTYILRSAHPRGPFELWGDGLLTPPQQMAIDGTPFWDENGQPWLVYCHEWVQLTDGTMCARRLSHDLKRGEGEPIVLFAASDAPWSGAVAQGEMAASFVTDGPFFRRMKSGELAMLWSSRGDFGYDVGVARSQNGVLGPWKHDAEPIYGHNGGHGMLFRLFEGEERLVLHTEKHGWGREHAILLSVEEENGQLLVQAQRESCQDF